VHRDLAARNVLLTKDGEPKLSVSGDEFVTNLANSFVALSGLWLLSLVEECAGSIANVVGTLVLDGKYRT
jgi:hypothetical protein